MKYDKLIYDTILGVDWAKLSHTHSLLNIVWQSEDENGDIYDHVPSVDELKEELLLVLKYAISKNLPMLECGNWVIIWHNEEFAISNNLPGARIEAFFVVAESYAMDSDMNLDILQERLNYAIEHEQYEDAARYRDKINLLQKEQN